MKSTHWHIRFPYEWMNTNYRVCIISLIFIVIDQIVILILVVWYVLSFWNEKQMCKCIWINFNCNGPLARYAKLRIAHAPGMPGTFSQPPPISDPDMLTCGFLWTWWREKRSRHYRRMRNPQFYVSGKRPISCGDMYLQGMWYSSIISKYRLSTENIQSGNQSINETISPDATMTISCKAWNSPAEYPSWAARCDTKESDGAMLHRVVVIINAKYRPRTESGNQSVNQSVSSWAGNDISDTQILYPYSTTYAMTLRS